MTKNRFSGSASNPALFFYNQDPKNPAVFKFPGMGHFFYIDRRPLLDPLHTLVVHHGIMPEDRHQKKYS